MAPTVLTLLANGFEEIEATAPIDLLRRADAKVTVASCSTDLEVTGRSNITLRADTLIAQITDPSTFDLLLLPGGPAVFDLRKRTEIIDLIKAFAKSDKPVGAICAAPFYSSMPEFLRQIPVVLPMDPHRTSSPISSKTKQLLKTAKS